MKQINAQQLAETKTFITTFMLDRSSNLKTFGELTDIFETSYTQMSADPSSDLRILKFSDDMERGNWTDDIVVTIRNGLAKAAIHRGIAFLRCVRKGVQEKNLPKVFTNTT